MPDDDEVRAAAAKGAWIDFDDDELAAELLYSILADEDSTPKPRSLKIRRAHVAGTLDLEAVTLRCPMRMEDCRFDEPITLEEAIAPAIRLIDCELVRLEAPQLETRGDLDLTRSTVSSGVSLRGAHIGGQLVLRGASLAADDAPALDAAGVRVEQDMYCDHDGEKRFSARGGVAISRAYIGGVVGFNGAELTGRDGKALQADGARVVRAMGCSAANSHPFTAHGEVNLRGAHLDSLSMHGAVLTNEDGPAFEADMLRVDKSLIFGSSDHSGFEAIGEVRLGGCRVGVQLIFEGASLSNPSGVALRADGVHVVRGLYFDIFGDRRFVAKGEVRLVGAHAEELVFDGACLTDSKVSLRAAGLDIAGDAIFEGHDDRRFTAAGGLQLRAARIGGELSFTQASIGAEAIAIDLSDSDVASLTLLLDEVPAGALDLRRARVGAMAEMSRADGTWVKAHLDGCAYRSIEARPRVSVDARLVARERPRRLQPAAVRATGRGVPAGGP
jgi:hypothetical protein